MKKKRKKIINKVLSYSQTMNNKFPFYSLLLLLLYYCCLFCLFLCFFFFLFILYGCRRVRNCFKPVKRLKQDNRYMMLLQSFLDFRLFLSIVVLCCVVLYCVVLCICVCLYLHLYWYLCLCLDISYCIIMKDIE